MRNIVLFLLFSLVVVHCDRPVNDKPVLPILVWYNSELSGVTEPVLDNLGSAGFNLAAMPFDSKEKNLEWLNIADSLGIQLILSDHRIDRYIQDPLAHPEVLDSMMADYMHHASFAGYFIYDKPDSQIFKKLSACIQYLNEGDPYHPSFINLYPVPGEQGFYYELWQVMDHILPRLVCFEQYPEIGEGSIYYENLEALRSVCLKQNVPYWVTLITTMNHVNEAMEKSQLKMQVYSALAYGATGLAFYSSSVSDESQNNGFNNNHKSSKLEYFDYICELNRHVEEISPVQEKLSSTGVFHTHPVPQGCIPLSPGLPITQVDTDQFLIGLFTLDDQDYAWLVNKNIEYGAAPQITFDPKVRGIKEIGDPDQNTQYQWSDAGEHKVRLIFNAGEGRLFRLKRE